MAKQQTTIEAKQRYAKVMLTRITKLLEQYQKAKRHADLLPPEIREEDLDSIIENLAEMRANWEKQLAELGG